MTEEMSPDNDGRKQWEWQTKYPARAWFGIIVDGLWITLVGVGTVIALYFVWKGTAFTLLSDGCAQCTKGRFDQFAYLVIGGVFGGLLFGVKYFYKVVAHGWWHTDRRIWRLFSPFLAGGLALAVGALVDSGILVFTIKSTSSTVSFSVGFITGYFADSAVAKMQEIAHHVFGTKSPSGAKK